MADARPSLMSIQETAHTLMNHPVCETPGWQFIAGSGFKSRPHRMSMRTSRLFCRDVAIPYFITEIFFSHWDHIILPSYFRNETAVSQSKLEECAPSGFTTQCTKRFKKLLKAKHFIFICICAVFICIYLYYVFIDAEVMGRVMEDCTKMGNIVENTISHVLVS